MNTEAGEGVVSIVTGCVMSIVTGCVLSPALTDPNAAAAQQAVMQQQINALTYSPFGDSPLFRNPLSDPKKKEEVRRAGQ